MQQDGHETTPEGEHEEEKQLDQLKHIVSRTLEAKGVLGTIRAQLRAAVFTALDEQERANGVYLENYRVQKIKSSPESKLLLALMHEFFEFYELDRTLSVFMPEATWTQAEYPGRQQLSRDLGFASTSTREAERPILLDLLLERLAEPKPMGDRRASGVRSRELNAGGRRTPKSPGSANVSPRSPAKPSSTSVSSLLSPRSPRSARSPRSGGSGRTSTRSGAKQSPGSSPRTQNSTGLHGRKPHDSKPVMMANLANASLPEAVTREIASAKSRVLPEAFGEATSPSLARGRKSLSSPHSGRSDIEEEQKEYKVPGQDIWDGSLSSPSACNEVGNQSVSNDGSMPAVDQLRSTPSPSASASYDKEDDAASKQSQTAQSLSARDPNSPDAASPGLASLKSESVLSSIADSAPSSAYSNESYGLATPNAVASSSNEDAAQHTTTVIEHEVSGPSPSEKQPTTPPSHDNEEHAATTHNMHLEQSSLGSIGEQSFFSSPHEAKSLGKVASSSESEASSGRDLLGGPIAIDSVVSPLGEALTSHSVDAEEFSGEGSLATPAETVPAVHVLPGKEAADSFGAESLSGSPLAEDGQSPDSFKVDVAGATSTQPLGNLAAPSALEQNSSDASSLASSAPFSHKEAKPTFSSERSLTSFGSPEQEAVNSSSPNSPTFADRPKTLRSIDALSSESFSGNEDGLSSSSSQEKAVDQGLSPASRSSAQGGTVNTFAQEKAAGGSVSGSASAASDIDDLEVDSEVSDNNGLMNLDTEENDVGDFDEKSLSSKKEDSQSVASLSPVRTQAAAAPVPPLATQGFDASFDSDGEDFGVSLGAPNVATEQTKVSEEQTKQSAGRSMASSFEDKKPSASPEGFDSDFDSEDRTFGVTFASKEPAVGRVEACENANKEDSDAGGESVAEHSMTEASVDHLHAMAKGQMNSEGEGEDEEDSASDVEDAGDGVDGIASDDDNDSENSRSRDGLFSASHEESNDFDVANQEREDTRASEDDDDDDEDDEDRGLERDQASDFVQDEDSMSHEDSMSLGDSQSISRNERSSGFGIDDQNKEHEDASMDQDEEEEGLGNDVSEVDEYAQDDQEMSHGDSHSISQNEQSSEFSIDDQDKEHEDASMDQDEEEEGLGNDVSEVDEYAQDDQEISHGDSHSISQNEQSSEFSIDDQDKEQENASMNQDEEEEGLGNDVSEVDEYAQDDQEMSLGNSHSISQSEQSSEFGIDDQDNEQENASMNQDEEVEGLGNDVSDIDESAQDDQNMAHGESHSFSQHDESSEFNIAYQDKEQEDALMGLEKGEDFVNEVSKNEGDTRNDTSAGLAEAGSSSLAESAGLMSPVASSPCQGITSPNEDEQSGFSFDASFNSEEDVGINLSGAPSMAKPGASPQMGSEELDKEDVGLLGREGEVEMDELDNPGEGEDAEDGHDVKSDDEDLSMSEDVVVENDDHSELEGVFGEKSHDLSGDEDNEDNFGDEDDDEGEDEDEDEEDYGEDFEEDFEEESGGEEGDEAQDDDPDGDEQMSIPSEVESVSSVESALSAKSGTSDLVSVEHDDAPTAHIKIDLDEQIVETVEHGVDDHTLESACDDVFGAD